MNRTSEIPDKLACNPVATIAVAQLLGTSLWFSANGAASDLRAAWHLSVSDIGILTNAVQLGFILGTLSFALTGRADRFRASRIFVTCALLGAALNASFAWFSTGLASAAILRFAVGVCLAGIYPIGMKLIVSWAPERAGAALAYLVAMLTLGTALPHAIHMFGAAWKWQHVILTSSVLAALAAALIHMLGDGPHLPLRAPATRGLANGVLAAIASKDFRAAALGYFGHMWELYAFWTIIPLLIVHTSLSMHLHETGVSGLAFAIIGAGAFGCLSGGLLSHRVGSARVAAASLALSGLCCFGFALGWRLLSPVALVGLLLLWGIAVVADSPQFSALSARACPPHLVGSALAIQNSIGFAITTVSITATTALFDRFGPDIVWVLLPGPLLGLLGCHRLWARSA